MRPARITMGLSGLFRMEPFPMTSSRYWSSRPHESVVPRPQMDAHQRYRTYGPIQPMTGPGLLERIFGKR